jgi:choloylglycine hydrolase
MRKSVVAALLLSIMSLSAPGFGCSLLMNTDNQGTFVGRTMEWFAPLQTRVVIYPRGFVNHDDATGMTWTSKYGAVVFEETLTPTPSASDGINEKGLTAHVLYQQDMNAPPPAAGKPKVDFTMWVRYVLKTSATVNDAVRDLNNYQIGIREVAFNGTTMALLFHFALNDASGDAAVIEFNGGQMQVFHAPRYFVMTNEPNLPGQLLVTGMFVLHFSWRVCRNRKIQPRPRPSWKKPSMASQFQLSMNRSIPTLLKAMHGRSVGASCTISGI